MPYNKGTLDAYRKIVTKDIIGRNLELTGSIDTGGVITVGGNVIVSGSISGSSYVNISGGGDMLKSVYDTDNDGTVNDSDKLEGLTKTQVQTHAPASHSGSHESGSGDAISIYKNQIRDINNYVITTPRLSVTGSSISSISGSLIVTGSISGSSYDGPVVTSVMYSGSTALTKAVTFTGSGAVILSQSGQVVTVSGSQAAAGVSGFAKSGSTELTGNIYVTGSTSGLLITQSGNVLDFALHTNLSPTNIIATTITGSGIISGANIYGPTATITDIKTTNITSTNVTGSTLVSGSTLRGLLGAITNVVSTTITGSTISGSTYQGNLVTSVRKSGSSALVGGVHFSGSGAIYLTQTNNVIEISGSQAAAGVSSVGYSGSTPLTGAVNLSGSTNIDTTQTGQGIIFSLPADISLTNITATNITGSTLVSGSSIFGKDITATNITGSTIVSGSSIYGKDAIITNVTATTVTGSSIISGSNVYGADATITNITGSEASITDLYVTNYLSGSTFSGSITQNLDANARVAARKNSGGTGYKRRRLNFIEGTNVTLSVGDDAANEEVDVTIAAASSTASGSKGPYSYIIYSGSGGGGPYYADDDEGNLLYSGSNATTVISSVLGDATDDDVIKFKGTFGIGTTVTLNENNTGLIFDMYGATLNLTADTIMFDIHPTVSTDMNLTIYGGHFVGNGTGSNSVLRFMYAKKCRVYDAEMEDFETGQGKGVIIYSHAIHIDLLNCWIHDNGAYSDCVNIVNSDDHGRHNFIGCRFGNSGTGILTDSYGGSKCRVIGCEFYGWEGASPQRHGIYLSGYNGDPDRGGSIIMGCTFHSPSSIGTAGILIKNASNIITGNHFYDMTSPTWCFGISIYSEYTGWTANNNVISGNTFEDCYYGIKNGHDGQASHTLRNQIIGNTFSSCSRSIYLVSTTSWWTRDTIIRDNLFYNGTHAFYFDGNSYIGDTVIEQNYLESITVPFYNSQQGQNPTIRWNIGYVTDNSGYQYLASSGSFAHSLEGVPTWVSLTASGSIPLEFSWIPSGSTGIYVYHTAGGQVGIFWKAEV